MYESEIKAELRNAENKLRRRYSPLSKLFILITILFTIFVIVVFLGIYSLGYGHNWAILNLDAWIIVLCTLLGFFIILELIFYFHFSSIKNKRIELEKPWKEFIDGKRVYAFTYPEGKEGGIFSKTYIEIDNTSVLRLRNLIIPAEELWGVEE